MSENLQTKLALLDREIEKARRHVDHWIRCASHGADVEDVLKRDEDELFRLQGLKAGIERKLMTEIESEFEKPE